MRQNLYPVYDNWRRTGGRPASSRGGRAPRGIVRCCVATGLVLGLPLGFLAGRVREVEEAADPYLNFLLMVPVAALLPD